MAIIRLARRTRAAPQPRRVAPTLDVLEERLLTLRAGGGAAETAAQPLAFPRDRAAGPSRWQRCLVWSRSYGRGAFWLAILAICGTSAYFISRGGDSTPTPAPPVADAAFAADATDSGRLAVPLPAGDLRLLVDVEPVVRGDGAWFWCLDSDRGLPPDQHICAAAAPGDPASGAVPSGGVVHIAAAQARVDRFFVQMYCPAGCRWRAVLSPASPLAASSPVALSPSGP